MLVVIPFFDGERGDKWLAIRNLEWAIKLDGKAPFECLLAYDTTTDASGIVDLATQYFTKVNHLQYDAKIGDKNWPRAANHAWQAVARHLYERHGDCWFWWEPDASPLEKGFLTTLAEEYKRGGKPFMGAMVSEGGYMAGVGVYPSNVCHYSSDAFLVDQVPFDVVLGRKAGRFVHPANHLIQHIVSDVAASFPDRASVDHFIQPGAVLFHKCKDASLIDILMGVKPATIQEVFGGATSKSFTQQTEWKSGFFFFPPVKDTVYFNPAIVDFKGETLLLTRRWIQKSPGQWASDVGVWAIGKNMVPIRARFPTRSTRVVNEQWEDPRAMVVDGRLFVSLAVWYYSPKPKIHQILAELQGNHLQLVTQPIYRGNGPGVDGNTRHEKNWLWFRHDDVWHFVYQMSPHIVARLSDSLSHSTDQEWVDSFDVTKFWKYGEPRGGTAPILHDGEYYSFFHSSTMRHIRSRRYYMGAYAFEAKPPFRITRMTREPLLVGSEQDPRSLGGPCVVWPGGAVKREEAWLIALGINDEACGWIQIPFDDLDARMEPVKTIADKILDAVFSPL